MFINSRMERRLSIAATALLTAAIFVMPVKPRGYSDARATIASYVKIADASPEDGVYRNHSKPRPH